MCTKQHSIYVTKLGICICSYVGVPSNSTNRFHTWNPDLDQIIEKIFLGNEAAQNKKE